MKNFSIVSFVSGVIIGVLLAGAWYFGGGTMPASVALSSAESTTVSSENENNSTTTSGAVAVVNQLASSTVMVSSITVPPPGVWLAVREVESKDKDLGNVLGAVRIGGPRSDISVPLLRATMPASPYAIELYRDDNNGAFDPAVNSVYVDFDSGAPVISYFTTVP